MLSPVLVWVVLIIGVVRGFLDLDELKNVYYGIDISDTPLLHPSELPSDAVILSSRYGQLYQCTYPPVLSDKHSKGDDSNANNVTVAELLSPMKQLPCLFSSKGWWTYEFCYGREIKQYHTEDGKIAGNVITLGLHDVENDAENESQQTGGEKRSKSVERYHRHMYVNGTLCDLTGKNRETEVRFLCQEGHGDFISTVDERETCSYVLTVHTSRICAHPSFGPPTSVQSLHISCNPLLSASDYEMYMTEYPDGVSSKDSSTAGDAEQDTETQSSTVQKMLIESMLKSMQGVLKQQHAAHQPPAADADVGEMQSETLPALSGHETASATVQSPMSDNSDVEKDAAVDDISAVETDASLPSDESHDGGDVSQSEPDTDSAASAESPASAESAANGEEDSDDEVYVKEFENEVQGMASTSEQRARLAKYKDNIASAMQAQFANILHEAQVDMAQQGDEPGPVDTNAAFKNLEKTLNVLLERLEKVQSDGAAEKADDSRSDSANVEKQNSVSVASDDDGETSTANEDGAQERSADDSIPENQEKTSKSSEAGGDVAGSEEGGTDDQRAAGSSVSKETIRDRLEKAGIRTTERKLDLKIITAGNTEYTTVQMFSDEDGSPTGRIFIAVIGDDDDAVKEQERNNRLEENYRFKWKRNQNKENDEL